MGVRVVLYMHVVYMCDCVHVCEYVSAHKKERECLYGIWEFVHQKFLVQEAS